MAKKKPARAKKKVVKKAAPAKKGAGAGKAAPKKIPPKKGATGKKSPVKKPATGKKGLARKTVTGSKPAAKKAAAGRKPAAKKTVAGKKAPTKKAGKAVAKTAVEKAAAKVVLKKAGAAAKVVRGKARPKKAAAPAGAGAGVFAMGAAPGVLAAEGSTHPMQTLVLLCLKSLQTGVPLDDPGDLDYTNELDLLTYVEGQEVKVADADVFADVYKALEEAGDKIEAAHRAAAAVEVTGPAGDDVAAIVADLRVVSEAVKDDEVFGSTLEVLGQAIIAYGG